MRRFLRFSAHPYVTCGSSAGIGVCDREPKLGAEPGAGTTCLLSPISQVTRCAGGVEQAQPPEVLVVINLPAGIALGQQLDRRGCRCVAVSSPVGVLAPYS
jgi:hypothetical protein